MKKVVVSRVDGLGDVVLTLPVAGVVKKNYPDSRIIFLGSRYARPLADACEHIDMFLEWNEFANRTPAEQLRIFTSVSADIIIHVFPRREIARLAARAKIPLRVGTSRRLYHWLYCNRRMHLPRRGSNLHEAQLNLKLLRALGAGADFRLSEIPDYYGLTRVKALKDEFKGLLSTGRTNLILHPKTKGSAREWGIDNFARLVELIPAGAYKIFITGTQNDGRRLREFLDRYRTRVVDLTGKMDLTELISFIGAADGLVAASTGPLHIAAALQKFALGLYAPMRPIHAGRWAPVGQNAAFLTVEKQCSDCRKSLVCQCIRSIKPEDVYRKIDKNFRKQTPAGDFR